MRRTVLFQCLVPVVFASFIAAAALGAETPPPEAGASQETRKIVLAHASAEPLGAALKDMFKKAKPLLSITGDKATNSLTVIGLADDIQQVESLAQEFDMPVPATDTSAPASGASQETRKVVVRHSYVVPLGEGLQALFEESKPRVRITAEKKTNSLIVVGEPGDIQQVEKLVRQFDVSTSQIEIQAKVIETETKADGNPEVHLNPGMQNLRSGNGGAPGMHLTVLNGQASSAQIGEAGGFAGSKPEPATDSGGYLTIPGIDTLPRKMVGTGRALDITAYEFGGQVVLVGVMTFTQEARTTAVADASGMAVVAQPVQVHFAVKIADPKTPCTIGPFETGPGRMLKVKIQAAVIGNASGGQAPAKEADKAPESGAAVGIEK